MTFDDSPIKEGTGCHFSCGTDHSSPCGSACTAGGARKQTISPRKDGINKRFGFWNFRQGKTCPYCKKFGNPLDTCRVAPPGWKPVTDLDRELVKASEAPIHAESTRKRLENSGMLDSSDGRPSMKGRAVAAAGEEEEDLDD